MRRIVSWKFLVIFTLLSAGLVGCTKDRPTQLMGRWFNNNISIRFRDNGSVLYNSRRTGLVEGRYHYDASLTSVAEAKPKNNLTIWLPQPGRIAELDFEMRFLGNNRIQMKPIVNQSQGTELENLVAGTAVVLKRALDENQESDKLDETPPLVSANPNPTN